jgi:hypothetical protein
MTNKFMLFCFMIYLISLNLFKCDDQLQLDDNVLDQMNMNSVSNDMSQFSKQMFRSS